MSRRARDRNFFFTVNLLQNVIFCVVTFLVAACAVPITNEGGKMSQSGIPLVTHNTQYITITTMIESVVKKHIKHCNR